jgi:hypothetical protein
MRFLFIAMFLFLVGFFSVSIVRKESKQLQKPTTIDGWTVGEWITYRKQLPHGGCSGYLTFNGQSTAAPFSETERFYTHVCDKCSATNNILNATWPQFKREWRDAK